MLTRTFVGLLASGHGARNPGPQAAFRFVAHDGDPTDLARTAIAGHELEALLAGTPARRRLLLLDAYQSGEVDPEALAAVGGTARAVPPRPSNPASPPARVRSFPGSLASLTEDPLSDLGNAG